LTSSETFFFLKEINKPGNEFDRSNLNQTTKLFLGSLWKKRKKIFYVPQAKKTPGVGF